TGQAFCSVVGVGSLVLQLTNGNTFVPYGTPVSIPLPTTAAPYTAGSSQYQWGATLTALNVNGHGLAVQVSAAVKSGTATISANSLAVVVTYVLRSEEHTSE